MKIPAFANETEEANWWYDNREEHAAEFSKAFAEGRVRRGGIAQRLEAAEKARTIQLDLQDALSATRLVEKKGMAVEAYLADLVHTAIRREVEAA